MPNKINYRAIEGAVVRQEGQEGRRLTFVASDGTRDSAGTVLNQGGWSLDRFNKNGIIGYQHKVYGSWDGTDNPDNVIGKGSAYVKDEKLMVDVEFEPGEINPLAEKIYQKLLFGSLNAVSVGFLPIGRGSWGKGEEALDGEKPTYYYAGQELLEVSVVNIPANPNALKKSFIEEAMEAEMQELRRIVEDESGKDPDPEPEPQERDDAAGAASRLEMQINIARAALL